MPHIKPRSLKPMTREQKLWLTLTIILFVAFMCVGWYFTVARAIQKSIRESHQTLSTQLDQTKQQFIGKEDLGQKTQEALGSVKGFFEDTKNALVNRQKAQQAILENVKEELNKNSTH